MSDRKRAKLEGQGCSWRDKPFIIVPVYKKSKFAMPVDLVYDNLACLLGLENNPWNCSNGTTTTQHSNEGCLQPNTILLEMEITVEMCRAYVRYRRHGCPSGDCRQFLIQAAAPNDLLDEHERDTLTLSLRCIMTQYLELFRGDPAGEAYTLKKNVGYFAERRPSDITVGRVVWLDAMTPARLHDDEDTISEMRKKVRQTFYFSKDVKISLGRMDKQLTNIKHACLADVMCDAILPYYNVPLLQADEEML